MLLYYYIRRLTDVISVAYRLSGSLILGIFSCVEKNYRFETADINIIGYASYFFAPKTSLKIIVKAVMDIETKLFKI